MKKFATLLLLMFFLASASVFSQDKTNKKPYPPNGLISSKTHEFNDIAPNTKPGAIQFSDDEFDLQFEYPCGQGSGETGIETDGSFFYTTMFNGNQFCRYETDGTFIGLFSVPGAALVRDLAYDGTYFYGAAANTTVFQMDFSNQTLIGTITAPNTVRAIAYDEFEDAFWVNNWSTYIYLFNRSGTTLKTIPTVGNEYYYGFAFDPQGPFLWGFSQKSGTSQNMLYKMALPEGNIIEEFDMCSILSLPIPAVDVAGGLYMYPDLIQGTWTLGGLVQNVCLWGIEMGASTIQMNDVGVQSFISPVSGPDLGNEIVTIRIYNFGNNTQNNIPVSYTINGGAPVNGVITNPLSPGTSADFTFPGTVNLSNAGQTYIFVGCTALDNDENPENNCKTSNVTHLIPGYCDASTSIIDEYIANVLCGSINNSSGWQDRVADYTSISTTIISAGSEAITVTNGTPYQEDLTYLWIDWNKDLIFGSGEEELILTNVGGNGDTFTGTITVPDATAPGEYRMRIRMTYLIPPEACENADYGEVEDYTIIVIDQAARDVGIQAILSPVSGTNLANEVVTVRVKNYGFASQTGIPVSYSVDGGTEVNGIIAGPLAEGVTVDYSFEGIVNLSNFQHYLFNACTSLPGDEIAANNCKTADISNTSPAYCMPFTKLYSDYIYRVICGEIDNISDWQSGVADYTTICTTIVTGVPQAIDVTVGNPWESEKVTTWIDWNKDSIFNIGTNEEFVLSVVGGSGTTFNGFIVVPEGTPDGHYRVRIRLTYLDEPTPCGNADYGEVEDYTIILGNVSLPPPTDLHATITDNDVYLHWFSSEGDKLKNLRELLCYNIYRDGTYIGFNTWNFYDDYDLEPGPYSYLVTALYEEGESMPAGPVTIIVPPEAEILVNPTSIIQNVPLGGTAQSTLAISNTGGQALTYIIAITYPTVARIQSEPYDAIEAANRLAERMAADGISADLVSLALDKPGGILPDQKNNETIRYDDGKNFSAIGLTTGGTFGISTYYPAATLTRYEGWSLSQLGFYIDQVPEICKIKIYGEGTSIIPGELRYEEIVYPTGSSWNIFTLSDAVLITGEDLWLGLELTHQAGTNPAGCDDGPAIAGFGDMISFNNTTWAPLSNCGFKYNWNLAGYLVETNPEETNDVGVQAYLSPHNGTNLGDEVVKIQIKNYGTAQQSNIPVFYTLDGGAAVADTVPGPIAPGETTDFTFEGTVNLGNPGQTYLFLTCTALSGDENVTNDCHHPQVTNLLPEYCPASTTTEDEYIANVLMGSINNSSGWQNDVADYTAISTTTQAGASQEIKVTNGNPWAADIVYAWVDWNLDNEFDVNNEAYFLTNVGGAGATFTGLITVPAGQLNGDYRLRIRMTYSIPPHPCCSSQYGEVEDYTIKVAGGQPNWIMVPTPVGTVFPGATANVPLHFDATELFEGSYIGNLRITNNSGNAQVWDIPVTLLVGQCPLPPPLNIEGYEILPNIAYLSWQVPEPSGDLLGYNIYRNNQKINPEIVTNLFYEDSLTNPSQYFYFITAVYPECEASSDTISLVITNLSEKENRGITIFPNPATNLVNIKSQHSIIQISIINSFGQVVFSGDFESNSVQVNTSGINKGIYMIQVKTVEGGVVKKLVIQ